MEECDIEQLKKQVEEREQQLQLEKDKEYARAVGEQQIKEVSAIAQDVNKTLETKLNMKLTKVIDTDAEVDKHLTDASRTLAVKGAETLQDKVDTESIKAKKEKAKATFELSESKWRAFGCKQLPDKKWQQAMIEFGSNVWFIIKYIVCILFFAPFYFFADMIDSQKGALKTIMIAISWLLLIGVVAGIVLIVLKWCNVL